ncbi:hypothetical protein CDAR_13111 [Caerostris darwini]|uniref:Uncharacterized protein n=1 Tax=Caerostris darwini TaxID=1538125 RepID=A0AAV4Q8V7_9ARAC|nr:hypothetical protein CDAR_13111 [Caerostris darwini]
MCGNVYSWSVTPVRNSKTWALKWSVRVSDKALSRASIEVDLFIIIIQGNRVLPITATAQGRGMLFFLGILIHSVQGHRDASDRNQPRGSVPRNLDTTQVVNLNKDHFPMLSATIRNISALAGHCHNRLRRSTTMVQRYRHKTRFVCKTVSLLANNREVQDSVLQESTSLASDNNEGLHSSKTHSG